MKKSQKQTFKKVVSLTIGIPAAIVSICEVNDLSYWWMPFAAMGVLMLIAKWNHVFDENY